MSSALSAGCHGFNDAVMWNVALTEAEALAHYTATASRYSGGK